MTTATKIRAAHVKQLLEEDQAVIRAARALEEAKEQRQQTRDRLKHLFPAGQAIELGDVRVKRSSKNTGRKFSLSKYLEKGHSITKEMRPFVSKPTAYDAWSVKDLTAEAGEK